MPADLKTNQAATAARVIAAEFSDVSDRRTYAAFGVTENSTLSGNPATVFDVY
jgi:hypothetical protein